MACGGGPLAGLDLPHAARIKHKQVLNKETFFSLGLQLLFCAFFCFCFFSVGGSWPVFGSPAMPTRLLRQSLPSTLQILLTGVTYYCSCPPPPPPPPRCEIMSHHIIHPPSSPKKKRKKKKHYHLIQIHDADFLPPASSIYM